MRAQGEILSGAGTTESNKLLIGDRFRIKGGEQNHVFDGVIAASDDLVLYKHGEGVELLYGAHVTPGTFEFFGMPALYGRVLQPADYQPGAPPVFVMRHKIWMERCNGDPGVLNKTFVLNGTARTLIGIMPPRFGWYEADVLIHYDTRLVVNAARLIRRGKVLVPQRTQRWHRGPRFGRSGQNGDNVEAEADFRQLVDRDEGCK
jgi:hypothetical protein